MLGPAPAPSMAATKQPREFPFVFFGHGPWGYPDEIENIHVSLVFAADVPVDVRDVIESSAPAPLGHFQWPLVGLVTFGPATDDRFDAQVRDAYRATDDVASRAYVQRCADALDAWLIATHARAPLTCVLGWFGELRSDPWAAWSVSVARDRALPRLLTVLAGAEPELVRRTLTSILRIDARLDDEVRQLYQRLTGDAFPEL